MIETDSTDCTCDPVSDRVSDKRTFTDNKSSCATDDKPIDHILDDLNLLDEKTAATIGQHIINSLTLPAIEELVHGNSSTCEIVQQFVGDLSDQLVKCIEGWHEKQNIKWATIEVCFLHKFKTLCKDAFSKTEQMSTAEKIACAFYIINEMPFRQMEQLAFNREFDNSRKQIIVFTCFLLQNFGFAKALSATLKQDDDDWFNTKFEIMTELIQDLASDQNFTTVSDNCEWVIECADLLHIGCTVQNLKAKQQNLKKRKVKNCGNAVRDRERLFVHNNNMLLQQVATDGNIYDRARDPPGQRSVYIPPGDIYMESYRLSTFIKYPQEVPVNPRHLASAGFYYTGYKDRVKCFSCGLCCENWVFGDDVRSAQWHRSDCAFMRGGDSGNVPIGGGALARFMMPPRSPEGNNAMDTGPPSSNFTASIGTAKQVEQRSQVPSAGSVLLSHSGGSNQAIPMQTARPVARNQPLFQIVEFATIPSAYHENFLKNLDLRKESERARTFEHWPSETPTVYPADLARSGFFYLGNLDRVQCFSCGGVLRNWNYGDNVQAEHRRHFPHCKMCQGSETRNVQLTPDERAAVPSQQTVFHEPPDPSENEARDLRNMFQCQYPVSPHMRNEETRFETFDHRWPASQVNATPRQIARAGFFFLGERDRVKCWYCNGGLQNWDPQDEPWTEHAKWFPTCEFLLQRKGPDFVHRMVSMFPNLRRPLLRSQYVPPSNPAPTARGEISSSDDEGNENTTQAHPATSEKPSVTGRRSQVECGPYPTHPHNYNNTTTTTSPSVNRRGRGGTRQADPQPALRSSEQSSTHAETGLSVRNRVEELKQQAKSIPQRLRLSWTKQQLQHSWVSSAVPSDQMYIHRALHLVCFSSLSVFDVTMQNAETAIELHPSMLLALAYMLANPSIVSDLKEMPQRDWIAEKAKAFKELLMEWWISMPEIRFLLRQCIRIIRNIP
uniref:ZF(RING)-14 zinc finger protein n=1 Tax=Phallusia mammillata TaxID=59560 RepID=A0A6F9D725_9ASCI|nr:ZF(RING)-14 zinc finger protein [Phallusia mammillata]